MADDRFRCFPRRRNALLPLVAMAFSLLAAAQPSPAQEESLPGLAAVLGELRKGGLVVYFRHGLTEQSGATDETANLDKCETQRQLSAEGREQSRNTGRAFRALRIPVGNVLSSPFCRCKDTAQLAFGRYTVNHDLYFAINADTQETKRLGAALRLMLATPPKAATNDVIVAHTANLREAAGIWPKPEGVAYVFRPLPGGRFEAVAKVLPEEWDKAAATGR